MTNPDLEFLIKLEKKHHQMEMVFSHELGKHVPLDKFTDRVMTPEEIKRVLEIVQQEDLIFYPKFGSSPSYQVIQVEPGTPPAINPLLTFLQEQLPEGCDRERLSSIYLNERNLEQIKQIGLPEIRKEYHRES